MFSVFGFFAILTILFSTPTEVKAESTLSKVYTTYIIEPGVFAIETLNDMLSTLTGGGVSLLANTASTTSSSNIIDDYIIEPLGNLLYSIFDFSVDVVEPPVNNTVVNVPPLTPVTAEGGTPPEAVEPTPAPTTPPVVNYYTTEGSGSQGATGERGPQGPRGERGPAGSDAVVDTSNFVNSSFFDNQVDGILGSIEDGISGLGSSLAEEFNTGLLDVSGAVTIGSALSGTDKALVVNNNTSTGNIAEFQDNGTTVFTIADGGNVGVGTSAPSSTLHVVGKSTFNGITPTLVATISTDSSSQATGSGGVMLDVQGNYAYVINPVVSTMQIFDISTPTSPTLISTTSGVGNSAIAVQGHYAYTAAECGNLIIVDVSNPYLPVLRGQASISSCAEGIFVSGKYVHIPGILGGGVDNIIDVSNPDAPVNVGTFANGYNATDIYVQGNYA